MIEYKNHVDSFLELIEETNDDKSINFKNKKDNISDFFISSNDLNLFEFLDKSFSNLLLDLSYKVNSELFKINLINKITSEDTFKYLSNNTYVNKHPHPFVIRYDLDPNNFAKDNKSYGIYLFNITNVELEFYNLDLSVCRNNINQLKNEFQILNKKQRYWEHKELTLNNLN